jgi:hypothetical protein
MWLLFLILLILLILAILFPPEPEPPEPPQPEPPAETTDMTHAPFRHLAKVEERHAYDPFAKALTVIQEQHRIVHDGFMFITTGKQTGLANAATVDFLLKVPAFTFPHVQQMSLTFGRGDIDVVAYEGTTVSADGSALTIQNVNRNSSNTPNLELYASPTVTTPGTEIFRLWSPPTGTGTGQSANGISGVGQGSEWVLQGNGGGTNYLVSITNNSGVSIDWSYEFTWYELDYD